jgi:hypothetical protein
LPESAVSIAARNDTSLNDQQICQKQHQAKVWDRIRAAARAGTSAVAAPAGRKHAVARSAAAGKKRSQKRRAVAIRRRERAPERKRSRRSQTLSRGKARPAPSKPASPLSVLPKGRGCTASRPAAEKAKHRSPAGRFSRLGSRLWRGWPEEGSAEISDRCSASDSALVFSKFRPGSRLAHIFKRRVQVAVVFAFRAIAPRELTIVLLRARLWLLQWLLPARAVSKTIVKRWRFTELRTETSCKGRRDPRPSRKNIRPRLVGSSAGRHAFTRG